MKTIFSGTSWWLCWLKHVPSSNAYRAFYITSCNYICLWHYKLLIYGKNCFGNLKNYFYRPSYWYNMWILHVCTGFTLTSSCTQGAAHTPSSQNESKSLTYLCSDFFYFFCTVPIDMFWSQTVATSIYLLALHCLIC